jgi:hypothetical protein
LVQAFRGKNLAEKIHTAADAEFFSEHAQAGVRRDEIRGLDTSVAFHCQKKLPQEDRPASASSRDSQILWRVIRQRASRGRRKASIPKFGA